MNSGESITDMKEFNTTGVCIPSKHYMVDISERVCEIKKLVDSGKYFTINRARQYGKTTTLKALEKAISEEYYVVSMDFQAYGNDTFEDSDSFSRDFASVFCTKLSKAAHDDDKLKEVIKHLSDMAAADSKKIRLFSLFNGLREIWETSSKPVVLFIDEVDSASDNQIFLDFLAQLRLQYLEREKDDDYKTFHSVVLAGVTDVRYLRYKIRPEDEHKVNSLWNIAADFNIDMSLSEIGIKGMLDEYENDHHTGMDSKRIAKLIREYTNGYPFLVSRICQLIDTQVSRILGSETAWSGRGIDEAIKLILSEDNTLFQSLSAKLKNYPELRESLYSILINGARIPWSPDQDDIAQMQMYGFIRNEKNTVRIDNRIFETRLYNLFLSDEEMRSNVFAKRGDLAKNQFVKDGRLDMGLILQRFGETYTEIFGPLTDRFKEKDGRELFLLYLRPIINGTGNYYIEAQTRDQTRTDVIVDYLGEQYIIELKIWRGERYNADGEKQICEYLDYFGLSTGYMLSFNFNKKKETGLVKVDIEDKVLFECTV